MMRHIALLSAVLFSSLLLGGMASGQVRDLSPEQLTRQSDVVVVGTVSGIRSQWNQERTRISSHVTIAVDQYLKGTGAQPTITITVPGGEVGETGETYSHAATFKEQEHVALFATRRGDGTLSVTAGDRGKMTITEDRATGRQVAGEGVSLEVLVARIRTAAAAEEQR